MKTINRAYKVLNETYSRRIYDSGRNFNGESDIEDYFDSDTSRLSLNLSFKLNNCTQKCLNEGYKYPLYRLNL